MFRKIVRFVMILVWMLAFPALSYGSEGETNSTDRKKESQVLQLPYAFYNESMGAAVGYVYGAVGYPQKQSSLVATIMAGSTGSGMGFLMANDLRLSWNRRLFFDPIVSIGYFQDAEAYIDGNPSYPYQRSGSNDSDEDDFVTGDGWDNFLRLKLKYLFPIGNGKNEIITNYVLKDGILKSGATGGHSLNPLKSGRSFFELRPFYRSQQLDGKDIDNTVKTNGLDFGLYWDNRDYYLNPTYGNSLRLNVSRDFGWLDSSNSWTSIDGELDVYFPLKESALFRKRVIALDFWTSYSPSWEEGPGNTVSGRPPAYTGATLGGLWRMKGYPSQRFSDKAAIYYSAEFRMTPKWNPFDNWHWLQKYVGVEWLQFVPFAELGRVAPSWDVSELHSDMKWSAGIGIRVLAKGIIARIDSAASEEGFKVQMMVNHPFQF